MKYLYKILGLFVILTQISCSEDKPVEAPVYPDPPKLDNFVIGTTMGFASHQEKYGGVVFKENEVPKDPYLSMKDHGANMVRLRIDLPPYTNRFTVDGIPVDFRSVANVKKDFKRAQDAELGVLLTFGYTSMALEDDQKLNDYVAPLEWQPIADDLGKLQDKVYEHTYSVLEDYISDGFVPKIVSIGNETSGRFLEPNLPESELDPYTLSRVVPLLNSGTRAVRDINEKHGLNIPVSVHIPDTSDMTRFVNAAMLQNLDFDILSVSHYHEWHSLGAFANWKEAVSWLKNTYNKDFLIIETAQLFTDVNYDNKPNRLGVYNIPDGYPNNPPTTQTQRDYLADFGKELKVAGAVGIVAWGGEWVGSETIIYADEWGPHGSAWDDKTFWETNKPDGTLGYYNLHDGVNWMQDVRDYNP
ncbi:glycosyl hydrolase 53 family protein [Pseudotamlana carrageenivorans]|uniref:Arabinogalactan endo-beta-1,4-galactanase n=1 Tax=Pseudotamlana carrageenivorans TaxID=2069432 RepID=A0A2I7SG88_9FLAO|nr:glycosyl hydrolase 53 family protein [Tamlana carrageenivorans]AUS04895.1 hypothetical protein C1A40_05155 [Tamlana carrageenivorans]